MEPTIGEHLARIRRQSTLTQEQLADRAGVSVETVRKLEQGERTSARMSTLKSLAGALGVPTTALMGNAAQAVDRREPDAAPIGLVGVRRALTPVAGLDGQPVAATTAAEPPTVNRVRRSVLAANTIYHANDYAAAITLVPSLLADARALVDATDGDAQLAAYALASQAHQLVGRLLIQLRQVDLAHVAITQALDHARRSGDQVVGAAAVAPMCWLLLRQARFAEAEALAVRTAEQVEPRLSAASPAELASWGFLLMKAASAAVRDARHDDARDMLDLAAAGAHRLGGRPNPNADVMGNDFSTEGVHLMRVEAAVIAGQPDQALALAQEVHRSPQVTPSSRQRHRLDVAWSHVELGQYADATGVLLELRDRAPAWLRQQRYAREIVRSIADGRRRAMSSELAELAALVGCTP
ncbi:Transcriptional regulator, contains XRE-family HTH domain [Micromonospora nigra]|uniref:Transcriptional regulator, contains XRE-family HTH domain n=1 Tax=Micromonospora nigra TaxID=145857 RepID=A0A1C6SQK7_9ACTN|nr:helix-turn-helix transcriptional regulator [Micromonospora nigra]SCL31810.1 Transcriptional regulator, contains XRE-family HTH domain [Micromonospora nigra]